MAFKSIEHTFSGKKVTYHFDADFRLLEQLVSKEHSIIITDENVFEKQAQKFLGWKAIVIKAGEVHKQQATADFIIDELIRLEADRNTFIIGIGGGVVTDITGYVASVYMRGLRFGFVPTTILAMVDASIGGKNGVDVGNYKNLVGLIRQPEFLLFDYALTETLPREEWINGFAEIIKHACIKDKGLFQQLEIESLDDFISDKNKLAGLIERNVEIKTTIVVADEYEKGDRKLLNFGHTIGHAIENIYLLPHGHAVAVGMIAACSISEQISGFDSVSKESLIGLLKRYHLPTSIQFNAERVWELLKMDKKRTQNEMNFILLNKIGEAVIKPIPLVQLEKMISSLSINQA